MKYINGGCNEKYKTDTSGFRTFAQSAYGLWGGKSAGGNRKVDHRDQ